MNIRLRHDGIQPGPPLAEPLRFGLQDTKGEVHPGTARAGAVLQFDLTLDVKSTDPPDFRGSFVHGVRGALFLSELEAPRHPHSSMGLAHQNPAVRD